MEPPLCLNNKSQGISNWVVHKAQYLLRFCKWGSKLSGLDCGKNSTVKRAWAKGVLGCVTTWEVLVTGCKPRKWWLMLCDSFRLFQSHFFTPVSITHLMSVKWTIQIMRIIGQLWLILMDMGHRLMTYTMQLISKMISNMLHCRSPSMLK